MSIEELAARAVGLPATDRREALHACAAAMEAAASDLLEVVPDETGLTTARVTGELARTVNQFRLLGDHAATPWKWTSPEAGVVTVPVPLGPVAVFAASNFPLAFGVSGGDTASALAAGCPVIVKAHPAQPRTSALIAGILDSVLPAGAFAMVSGGSDVSLELVRARGIKAVGFTGSFAGGQALLAAAAARPEPIPVYAEMSSLNPVIVLPGHDDVSALAASVTGSSGQLCTKPGLVVTASSAYAEALAAAVAQSGTHRMLTPAMAETHARWLERAGAFGQVVSGDADPAPFAVIIPVGGLPEEAFEEHFGPSVVIAVGSADEVLPRLPGSLTATVLAGPSDLPRVRELLPVLTSVAGRIVFNGVPTGVAVCDAMQHGGPWPATSASGTTSVGTKSIERFWRPVAYQGFPEELLPVA